MPTAVQQQEIKDNCKEKILQLRQFIAECAESNNPGIRNQVPSRTKLLEKLTTDYEKMFGVIDF